MAEVNELLARNTARRLIAAACRGRRDLWNAQESAHRQATSQAAAATAAQPMVTICDTCPITGECHLWAEADQYDGIAAGRAWAGGIERPVHWVPGHPPRKLAS